MSKRTNLFLGILMLILGVIKLGNMFIPENFMQYIFNFQVLLIVMGIYILVKKGIDNILGIFMIILGVYLYLEEFIVSKYVSFILPILLILAGILVIYKYILDNKKENSNTNNKGE